MPWHTERASVRGNTLTWDNNGTAGDGVQDGAGSWDTSLTNFFNGTSDVAWNNGNGGPPAPLAAILCSEGNNR